MSTPTNIVYQGEDIPFGIAFSGSTSPDIQSFDDIDEVIVYFYTNLHREVKFSTIVEEGFLPAFKIDSLNLAIRVPASVSKKMQAGEIHVEVHMMKDGIICIDREYETNAFLEIARIRKES